MFPDQHAHQVSIDQLLGRAFRIYKTNFIYLVKITFIAYVPMLVPIAVSLVVWNTTTVINLIESLFVSILIEGALINAIIHIYLRQRPSIGNTYQASARKYGSLWLASFLVGLASIFCLIPFTCAWLTLGGIGSSAICIVLIAFGFACFSIYLNIRLIVSLISIMYEQIDAQSSLQRSWNLTSGQFWHILGAVLIPGIITSLFGVLVQAALLYGLLPFIQSKIVFSLFVIVIDQLMLIIVVPFSTLIHVILYFDLIERYRNKSVEPTVQIPV